jgi:chromate transporter
MMMVTAIGERVAGPVGALVVVTAFFLPSGLLTFGVGRLWIRLEGWPWRDAIQRGLAPVSIGLVFAGTITIAQGALTGWKAAVIAALVFVFFLRSRINPALLVLGGAVAGLAAFASG